MRPLALPVACALSCIACDPSFRGGGEDGRDARATHDASRDAPADVGRAPFADSPFIHVTPDAARDVTSDSRARTNPEASTAGDADPPEGGSPFPLLLSQTGLFEAGTVDVVAAGIAEYEPLAELWADQAEKRRFVHLPDGARIDTADMDAWRYPTGTKFWKEFSLDGRRLETRLLQKRSAMDGDFFMMAYRWRKDGSDAEAVPDGASNVSGTEHDIPSSAECARCHGGLRDAVLGFTAVQLSGERRGPSLGTLVAESRLTHVPTASLVPPGNELERAALAYLHANCGHCHNRNTVVGQRNGYVFWLDTAGLAKVEDTRAFRTATTDLSRAASLDDSGILRRMGLRGNGQMPPLATERVDEKGVRNVRQWLERLQGSDAGL